MSLEENILDIVRREESGIETEAICRKLGKTSAELGNAFERLKRDEELFSLAGLWIDPEFLELRLADIEQGLWKLHDGRPKDALHHPGRIAEAAGLKWPEKSIVRALELLELRGLVRFIRGHAAAEEFRFPLSERQERLLQRLIDHWDSCFPECPPLNHSARELNVPIQALEEIVRLAVEGGHLLQPTENYWVTRDHAERLSELVLAIDGMLHPAVVREHLGVKRESVTPILALLEKLGRIERGDGDHWLRCP